MLCTNLPAIVRVKRQCAALSNAEANKISEAQKKAKRSLEKGIVAKALEKLTDMIEKNNGTMEADYVSSVAKAYGVKDQALYYQLRCQRQRTASGIVNTPSGNSIRATMITPAVETPTTVSTTTPTTDVESVSSPLATVTSTATLRTLILEATTLAAQRFMDARHNARNNATGNGKVAHGTLKKIVKQVEKEKQLQPGTLNAETIRTRVNRNNVTGFNPQSTSPLLFMDHILIDYIIRLSRMGKPLNKQEIIELARDMITNTELVTNYAKHLGKPLNHSQIRPTIITPGDGWYTKFMKRHNEKLKRYVEDIVD